MHTPAKLLEALQELDLIPVEDLQAAWQTAEKTKTPFETVLKESGLISDEHLGQVIADIHNWTFIRLSQYPIDVSLIVQLHEPFARQHEVVVFAKDEQGYRVATSHPQALQVLDFVRKRLGKPIRVSYATSTDIESVLNKYTARLGNDNGTENSTQEKEKTTTREVTADAVLEFAVKQRASDLHLEPGEEQSAARLRIDGILHDVSNFTAEQHQQMVTRIKVLAKLRTDEHQSAQDGKLHITVEGKEIDVRVSVLPTTNGEKVVMRILSQDVREFTLEDLGFSELQVTKLKEAVSKPYGMILSTGPTGSGKTTTLYTLLKLLNSREINITTIEDPVEYTVEGINQIQVNEATNLTFSEGLRSIVRQDPNVILVGEIRDPETANISVNAAMTGHLVLTTLHTNTASTAFPRLVDMTVEPFLVGSSVNIVIAQRLIRKVCPRCRVSEDIELESLIASHASANGALAHFMRKIFGQKETMHMYKGKGCPVCHQTGYLGRIGIYELLEVTPSVREGITDNLDASKIQELAVADGMFTMLEDGLLKVSQGLTTIEEVLRVTKE